MAVLCFLYVAGFLTVNNLFLDGDVGTWLAVGVVMLGIVWAIATYGIASGLSVILLISMLYGLAPSYDLYIGLGMSFVDAETYVRSFLPILCLYCASIVLGYSLFQRETARRSLGVNTMQTTQGDTVAAAYVALTFGVAAIYFGATVQRFGLVTGDFTRAEIYQHGNLDLRLIRSAVICGIFISASALLRQWVVGIGRQRHVFLLGIAVTLVGYADIAVLGDRRVFLSILISLFVASRPKPATILATVLVGVPFVALLWIYSFIRNVPVDAWTRLLSEIDWRVALNLANGEFGGWTRIAADILKEPFSSVWRLTILEAPFALLPSFVLPDRPLAPSLWYVSTFDPTTADIGGGWGFSLPIEAYMNGWLLGPCLLGLIVGGVLGRVGERGRFGYMLAVFTLCFSFRADAVSLLQQSAAVAIFYWPYRLCAVVGRRR